jgi:hypothetical protein
VILTAPAATVDRLSLSDRHRLARVAWLVLLDLIALGLVAGVVVALTWRPDNEWTVVDAGVDGQQRFGGPRD